MSKIRSLKTGDKVRYISDAYKDYQNQVVTAVDFDLEHRLVSLECEDGQIIAAYWNEIEEV